MVEPAVNAALDHDGNAADAEQQAGRLAPGHLLAEKRHGHDGGQHRVGADHQRRQAGRDALQADVAEPEIGGLVGDPEHAEGEEVTAIEPQRRPADGRGAEHQCPGEQEPRGEENERWAILSHH